MDPNNPFDSMLPISYDMGSTLPQYADPSLGTDVVLPQGTQHFDAGQNPKIFMGDAFGGNIYAAAPNTDLYSHYQRMLRRGDVQGALKVAALVGGGALAGSLMGPASGVTSDLQTFTGAPATAVAGESTFLPETGGALDALAAEAGVAPGTALTSALPAAGDVAEFGVGPGVAGQGGWLGALKGSVMNPDGSVNWSRALETFGNAVNPQQGDQRGGALSSLAGIFTKGDGTPAWGKIAGGALGALGALYANSKANKQASPPPLPAYMTQPLTPLQLKRTVIPPTGRDLLHYGEDPQGGHRFFEDSYVPKADGGGVRGPGSGRDDKIDALLSDGEYVMDAETVAMLGDGSLDEGAKRLDQMRVNIRKHKGKALAKGKFSPDAKAPEQYLGKAEGGPINPQLGVTELPPPNSSDPAPLPNAEGAYADKGSAADRVRQMISEIELDKLRQSLGSQLTANELAHFMSPLTKAKGGPIRPDLLLRSLMSPTVVRNSRSAALRNLPPPSALPPTNLERLTGVLDKSNPIDLSKLSPEDFETYRQWLLGVLNTPPQKAKGGTIHVIEGGFPKPTLTDDAAKLAMMKRMIEAYKAAKEAEAQKPPVTPPPAKKRGGLIEAQARVKALQKKFADGGPVKKLTEFADELEETLEEGRTDLAVGAN